MSGKINALFLLFFIHITFMQAAGLYANQENAELITLQEAIDTAQKTHPLIKAAQERVHEAKSGVTVSRAHFMPRLNVSETYMRTNDPAAIFSMNMRQESNLGFTDLFQDYMGVYQSGDQNAMNDFIQGIDKRFYDVDDQGGFDTKLQIVQPIYNGGKSFSGHEMAKINLEAIKKQKKRIEEFVTFNVINAYLNIYLAKESVKVAREAMNSASAHVKFTETHVKSGTIVRSDLLRAKVHLATVDEMLISSNNNLELAHFGFKRAIGIDPDDAIRYKINVDEFKNPDNKKTEVSEAELIKTALSSRKDLQAINLSIDAMHSQEALEKADYLPHINAWFNYDLYNGDNFDYSGNHWMAGASLTVNLFNGLSTYGKVEQAKYKTAAMKQKKNNLRQDIIMQVQKGCRNLQTALARVNITEKAIESAKETLRIVTSRYKSGIIPFIQVTDAEVALIRAETGYVKALYDARLASAEIDLSTGRINLAGKL